MKKLLVISLVFGFQNIQGTKPFEANKLLSDQIKASTSTCVIKPSEQGDFSNLNDATKKPSIHEAFSFYTDINTVLKPDPISNLSSKKKSSKSTDRYFSFNKNLESLSPISDEKLQIPANSDHGNYDKASSSSTKNTAFNFSKETLEFYDNTPQSAFHDIEINKTRWTEKPKDFCVTILLGRHVADRANMNKTAHTSFENSEITLETVGADKAHFLMNLGSILKFDAIAAGTAARHKTTARLVSSSSPKTQEYELNSKFNEQKLGFLGGNKEDYILGHPEFIHMFNDRNYKMKKDGMEEDQNSESGSEVISRFIDGIDELIDSVYGSRQLYIATHARDFPSLKSRQDFVSKNMLLYICTSRCTLNWMIKHCTGNMQLPLQMKIPNCNLFCVNYFPNTGKFDVLLDKNDMPLCISPMHFSEFALNNPVFSPFTQMFRQKVSQIIQKQDKKLDKKLLGQFSISKFFRIVRSKATPRKIFHYPYILKKAQQEEKNIKKTNDSISLRHYSK